MLRPTSFQQAQVVLQDVPYELCDDVAKQNRLKGVLCRGDLIWTKDPKVAPESVHATTAFLDGVGVVCLDPEALVPADVFNGREVKGPRHTPAPRPTHAEIAELAYTFWERRSESQGSAEQDWLRAEKELTALHSECLRT